MDSGMLSMLMQSLMALAFVLGLFALLIWGMRKLKLPVGNAAAGDFRVIRRLHLDSKNSLIEVSHEGRRYLLGISQAGMVQLSHTTSLPDQPQETVSETAPQEHHHA